MKCEGAERVLIDKLVWNVEVALLVPLQYLFTLPLCHCQVGHGLIVPSGAQHVGLARFLHLLVLWGELLQVEIRICKICAALLIVACHDTP